MGARELLLTQIQHYGAQHAQKENMTWAGATLLIGGEIFFVAADPFWSKWPLAAFVPFVGLLSATAVMGAIFVHQQFRRRRLVATYLHACTNVLTRWTSRDPTAEECASVTMLAFSSGGQEALKAVADEFELVSGADALSRWWDRDLTYVVIALWAIAAAFRIMTAWSGPAGA